MLKQRLIVQELYQACIDRDFEKQKELIIEELKKIFHRKEKGKKLGTKYTIIR